MIKKILDKFGTVLYVQIWEKRIKVTDITTKKIFDEKALVAVKNENGKKSIEAVGNNATLVSNVNTSVSEPFSHERLLLSNFTLAEILLRYILNTLVKRKIFVSPKVVIHPMEKIEGGLGQIEIRAFRELAIGAGARDAKVHQGRELSILNFDYESLPSDYH
ncbi:MAG: rod shape-determining protein [Thiotrichaceae bacterium]|nr:rod shape-determining protein [Thiotrichaceae bacterium]